MTGNEPESASTAAFVLRLLAGALVAAVGVYLLVEAHNPRWLSALQVSAGGVLILDAVQSFRRAQARGRSHRARAVASADDAGSRS